MKMINIKHLLIILGLLLGAILKASATDRFYMDAANIEVGETRMLSFCLDNDELYFGFQADMKLPNGLELVSENGQPSISLSSRADDSYQIVYNLLSDREFRFGTFSASHTAFVGNSGVLLSIKVKATEGFAGGELMVKDIIFIDQEDKDVEFPEISMNLGIRHNDKAYIQDFKIAEGDVKEIFIELDNETSFTAFQTDIILPKGFTIKEGSFKLSPRCPDHTVSVKSFSDGRTRIVCMSLSNALITGISGALVSFMVAAEKDIAKMTTMQLKNVIFTMRNAHEYILPNSMTTICTECDMVQSITLSLTAVTLKVNESETLIANVIPDSATDKSVIWNSSDESVATVSAEGTITAITPGTATIKALSVSNPDVISECEVTVVPESVSSIVQNSTSAPATGCTIIIDNGTITVEDLPSNSLVLFMDMVGRVLNQQTYTGQPITIKVQTSGVYILSTGRYTSKVVIQ